MNENAPDEWDSGATAKVNPMPGHPTSTFGELPAPAGFAPSYSTAMGSAFAGDSLALIDALPDSSINLALTSPPFALQREKDYGNRKQHEYVAWLAAFAAKLLPKLKEDGSLVVDLGGAYEQGVPTRSLYNFRIPIKFCDDLGYFLAEDFYWYNPSKLPSPIEWVNKRKIRVKDSVNTVWWFSRSRSPKANVAKVLTAYSERMKKLLRDPAAFYQPKKRPSGHDISAGFSRDNGGAIPSNLLHIANSESSGQYVRACKAVGAIRHPARFPDKLPQFFIRFLTDPGDVVLDFFAGSNTTGMVCEREKRQWLAFDLSAEYIAASAFRFMASASSDREFASVHQRILRGEQVVIAAD
jgi:site-specific DNA-methyltransferase (cytosine-N4-specific)